MSSTTGFRLAPGRFVLIVALLAIVAACTDPAPPAEPGIGSETTGPSSGGGGQNGDDGMADGSADGERGSDSTDRPTSLTPTDRFQRLPAEQFANASTEAVIAAAIPFGGGAWLLAGGVEDGRSRTVTAMVSVLSADDPENMFRIDLPADGAERSMAKALASDDDAVLAAGMVADGDGTSPVVWLGDPQQNTWELTRLPVEGSITEASADLIVVAGDTRYVVGQARVSGFERLLAWRDDGAGWQPMAIGRDRDQNRAPVEDRDAVASAAAAVSGRLLVVGTTIGATGDAQPLTWIEMGDVLTVGDGSGLPEAGSLHDVTVTPDSTLVVAGASTENGISTPLVATADGPDGPWVAGNAEVDLAGWVSFGGVEFGRLAADEDHLYTALTNPVVQQVSRSSDGGRTWERIGNLSLDGGNFVPADAMALAADGTILVAGADVVMELSNSTWTRLGDVDAVPTQRGSLQAVDVVAGDRGFIIGGGRSSRMPSELPFETVLWQSPDGVSWGRPPVNGASGYVVTDLQLPSVGGASALIAGGSYFTLSSVIRPDQTGRWSATALPLGEAFLEHTLEGVDGAIVAAGSRPREDLSQTDPLFVVIEPDNRVREIPLTNSPIPADVNGSVVCLAGSIGRMLAVLEWGDGEIGVAIGTNGERWRGLDTDPELGRLAVNACHGDDDGFLLGGRDALGRAVAASSIDGGTWRIEVIDEASAILGIDSISVGGGVEQGEIFLSGWSTAPDGVGRDATIWKADEGSWRRLTDIGLEGDGFSRFTEVTGLAAHDGIVVAVGDDRGRAGAWVATTDVLS